LNVWSKARISSKLQQDAAHDSGIGLVSEDAITSKTREVVLVIFRAWRDHHGAARANRAIAELGDSQRLSTTRRRDPVVRRRRRSQNHVTPGHLKATTVSLAAALAITPTVGAWRSRLTAMEGFIMSRVFPRSRRAHTSVLRLAFSYCGAALLAPWHLLAPPQCSVPPAGVALSALSVRLAIRASAATMRRPWLSKHAC
jgi:hypothetical protein